MVCGYVQSILSDAVVIQDEVGNHHKARLIFETVYVSVGAFAIAIDSPIGLFVSVVTD